MKKYSGYTPTVQELLDILIPEPGQFGTVEEWQRSCHEDLHEMTKAELMREKERMRLRLTLDNCPPHWFLERLQRIEAML